MEEVIKKISLKTLESLEKSKKLPFPLYYKEVFGKIAYDENIIDSLNPKLLCLEPTLDEKIFNMTESTIKDISNTSKKIKEKSSNIVEVVEESDPENLKAIVLEFNMELINQIDLMEKKIESLERELENAYKELLIDPLTKAYNRKALEKDLKKLLKHGNDKDLDIVVAIIDIDNFKIINDNFGHLVGDFVLKKLVQILKSFIRNTDKVYRYGGDEFVIVFNRCDIIPAEKIIERIIKRIQKTVLKYQENLIKITVSIGMTKHKKGDTFEKIIKRADDALYKVKACEKNGYNVN